MLSDQLQTLEDKVADVNAKHAVLEQAQAAVVDASTAYQAALVEAQDLRRQFRAELEASLPADGATGVTVR